MQEQDSAIINEPQQKSSRDFLGSIMRGDKRIWGIYFFLFCFSAVEIFSATSQLAYKSTYVSDPAFSHIRNLLLGLAAVLLTQSLSLKAVKAWSIVVWIAAVGFAVLTLMFGVEQKGASRSFAGIQPVEICKIGVVLALSLAITARDTKYQVFTFFRSNTRRRRFWVYLLLIGIATVPIATQNLSSGIIIGLTAISLLFLGRVYGEYLWWLLGIAAIVGILAMGLLKKVYNDNKDVSGLDNIENVEKKSEDTNFLSLDRLSTWANRVYGESDKPLWEEDVNGKKSQELCAHMAMVNGYPFGKFIGNSKMRDFLPEAYSDYIFSIIVEEWGPLGGLLILIIYLSLLIRCVVLARQTSNPYMRLVMIGLPLIMVIQALIHIGVCTGAMFVTGQPLPLLSRGGSSILGTSVSFGIILALSRLIQQEEKERLLSQSQTNEISD